MKNGGLAGTRTLDQCLKRALLYQLSYQPAVVETEADANQHASALQAIIPFNSLSLPKTQQPHSGQLGITSEFTIETSFRGCYSQDQHMNGEPQSVDGAYSIPLHAFHTTPKIRPRDRTTSSQRATVNS